MSITKYIGTGKVTASDFIEVKWEGISKGGNAITITLHNAINMGNLDWTFADKGDTVPSVEFTACYTNTDAASDSTLEPFEIEVNGTISHASDGIILGAGKFYVNGTLMALTRGGGQFTVEREYREINADGDRGTVKGRVVMEGSKPKLTMNILSMLKDGMSVYTAVEVSA